MYLLTPNFRLILTISTNPFGLYLPKMGWDITKGEAERKKAVFERDRIQKLWQELDLQTNIRNKLGMGSVESDPKIFSQKDLDAKLEEYHTQNCLPLEEELKIAGERKSELLDRLDEKDKLLRDLRKQLVEHKARVQELENARAALPKPVEDLLVACLNFQILLLWFGTLIG